MQSLDASPLRSELGGRRVAVYAALGAATLLIAFALRYASLYEPRWYGDEGIFSAIAQNMREGRTLYADAWDNKPPLIFFTYAGIQALFGTSVFALHLVTTCAVLVTQLVVMGIALFVFTARRALVAGVIFAITMGTPVLEGNLAMTETYMILPSSMAVLVFVLAQRKQEAHRGALYGLAGLLLGVAAGYKQVAVFDAAAIMMMIWLTHRQPLRAALPIALGFALPQALFLLLFMALGALPQYWYAVVGSLGLYSELSPAQGPFVKFTGYLPAILIAAWLVRRKRAGDPITMQLFPPLWLAFALAGAMSSAFAFPHYLQQAGPALALTLVANPFSIEKEDLSRLTLGVTAVLVAAVVFGQFAFAYRERKQLDPVDYYRTFASHRWGTLSTLDYQYRFDGKAVAVDDIVAYLKTDGAGTSVYTWSELPWIYAAGGFTNPARYYTSFLGEVVPGAKQEILRDLDDDPPAYVLVSDDTFAPFDELTEFLSQRYALIHDQGDWHVYRLTTSAAHAAP